MMTLQEARAKQEFQVDYLRKLQRDKTAAIPERKETILRSIELVEREIRELDTFIQHLLTDSKPKSS
jgi:hypothetical protein